MIATSLMYLFTYLLFLVRVELLRRYHKKLFFRRRLQLQCSAKKMRIGCTKAYYLFASVFVSSSRCLPYRGKLTEGLHLYKVRINTTLFEELVVCTLLGYATLVNDIDAISIINSAEAVCDDD